MRRGSVDRTPLIGHMGGDSGILARAYRSGVTFTSPSTSGAALQWNMGESSGNIVDSVASVSLAAVGGVTYGTIINGDQGITFNGSTGYFHTDSAVTQGDLGTSDFTIRIYAQLPTSAVSQPYYIFDCSDSGELNGYRFYLDASANKFNIVLAGPAGSTSQNWTISGVTINDGQLHDYKIAGVRASNATLTVDGIGQGNRDISSMNGVSIVASSFHIGNEWAGLHRFFYPGFIGCVRVAVGTSTNFG